MKREKERKKKEDKKRRKEERKMEKFITIFVSFMPSQPLLSFLFHPGNTAELFSLWSSVTTILIESVIKVFILEYVCILINLKSCGIDLNCFLVHNVGGIM